MYGGPSNSGLVVLVHLNRSCYFFGVANRRIDKPCSIFNSKKSCLHRRRWALYEVFHVIFNVVLGGVLHLKNLIMKKVNFVRKINFA